MSPEPRNIPYHAGGCLTNLTSAIGNAFGLSEHSRQKHSATLAGTLQNNPERAILNIFLAGIGEVGSVPIKPVSQIQHIRHSTPHPKPRTPTLRMAYALIASATAHGLYLHAPLNIPRCFIYKRVEGIIENGVARDILRAGMATIKRADNPKDEIFILDKTQVKMLISIYGYEKSLKRDLV